MNWELQLAASMTVEDKELLTGAKRAGELVREHRHGAAVKVLWNLLLPAARKKASRPRAFLLLHMGHVYRHWMIEVAFKQFRDAREICRKSGFARGEMVAECSLGELYLDWEDPARALPRFERCLSMALDCAGLWWQRDVLVEVVKCLDRLGHHERARESRRWLDQLDAEILEDLWGAPEESGPGLAVAR